MYLLSSQTRESRGKSGKNVLTEDFKLRPKKLWWVIGDFNNMCRLIFRTPWSYFFNVHPVWSLLHFGIGTICWMIVIFSGKGDFGSSWTTLIRTADVHRIKVGFIGSENFFECRSISKVAADPRESVKGWQLYKTLKFKLFKFFLHPTKKRVLFEAFHFNLLVLNWHPQKSLWMTNFLYSKMFQILWRGI